MRGVERGPGIRAILPVNGHTVALGDKADDLVAGNRRAAAAELDHARADVLDNNAGGIDGRRPLPRQRLGCQRPGCLGQIIADAAHSLRSGQTAVPDGGVHIVQAFKADLFENDRQDLGVLQNIGVNAGVTQFGLKAGLAAHNVLLALLALEPLLDFDARLIGLTDVQPVAARAFGGLRR